MELSAVYVQKYDVTTKDLVELRLGDWLPYIGLPPEEVEVVEAELSTISLAADKVLRIMGAAPSLLHIEFQSRHDPTLPERTLHYSVVLHVRHKLSVRSAVLLLSADADRSSITGILQYRLPDTGVYLEFRYQVVRVWEKPVEEVLAGGLGTLPLAPLSNVTEEELPAVIERMKTRIDAEATPEQAGKLWTATNVLMGLRYEAAFTQQLLQGVMNMKESVTYQAIVEEGRQEGRQMGLQEGIQLGLEAGRAEEVRRILLRQGGKRFGLPSEVVQSTLQAITTLDALETLTDRLLDVESWTELLGLP